MTESVWIRPQTEYRNEEYFGAGMWSRIFAYMALVVSAQILRWSLYVSHGFDLGFYQQALAAWVHNGFRAQSTYFHGGVLAHNGAWLMPVLAYPAAVFGTGFLFVVESLAVALGYIPIIKLAKMAKLPPSQAALLGTLYLLNPLLISGNLYDFHVSVLAAPLILWALLSVRESRLAAFMTALLLLTALGDHVALAAILLVLLVVMMKGIKPLALVSVVVVGIWLIVLQNYLKTPVMSWILPVTGQVSVHTSLRILLYGAWTVAPFVLTLLMFLKNRRFYLSPYWLLPLIGLATHVLSSSPAQTSPFDQNSTLLVPFLIWPVIDTAAHLGMSWPRRDHVVMKVALIGMIGIMVLDFYHSAWRVRPQNTQALTAALSHVSSRQWVYAQNNILPHLGMSAREIPLSRLNPQRIPKGAEIIWDTQFTDKTTPAWVYAYLNNRLHSHGVRIIFHKAGVLVFRLLSDHPHSSNP
ncbi:MAG: DUF2079 domain-containing protein [Firmicutes bacterium]|jgi:uncharacterized membrane protein|uniref:DUF2079 domain-containing protein n=1 Tax=Sulfobacillus benefaciens TaxID=453960 RepID=A0A2T2WR87_9FIRM|nr:DUF2079 domain-containing protein [Bacillota bacterium]MCL5015596.1 DUF2079 domain-containing protein [Bacillota bacterium]PSR24749.1 MAG: hypothetical protein C7B43_18250 [Sulfobacillus benefaciens]